MSREIVVLQAGQCGNQIGSSFWRMLAAEHGIGADGHTLASEDAGGAAAQSPSSRGSPLPPTPVPPVHENKDVFFYQADDDRYVPRAVLIDLEPGVLDGIKAGPESRLYNPENFFVPSDGGGAGNNWARGYSRAESLTDDLLDIIDREAEGSDSLAGFMLAHSVAGGTGSGLGSFLLEAVGDHFPKAVVQTVSVFPSDGDVVVQPYNTVLAARRLTECADSTIVVDNAALNRICSDRLRLEHPTFEETNSLVATVMAAATAPLRFPGYASSDLASLTAGLVPVPRPHFLTPGYTPIDVGAGRSVRKTTALDVLRRLLQGRSLMTSCNTREGVHAALLAVIRGDVDPAEMNRSLVRVRERRLAKFIDWGPAGVQAVLTPHSPHARPTHRVSGLALCNHTSIAGLFGATLQKFDLLFNKQAFVNQYVDGLDGGDAAAEFDESREVVQGLVDEYRAMETSTYLQDW